MKEKKDVTISILSILLSLLIGFVSLASLYIKINYIKEIPGFAIKNTGQDFVNLFIIIPILILSSVLVYHKKRLWLFIWNGIIFYLTYSYASHSSGLHYDYIFIAYLYILGVSFYSLVFFVFYSIQESIFTLFKKKFSLIIITYYLTINVMVFYSLRFSEKIPAIIHQRIPNSIIGNHLLINTVQF